MTPLPSLNCRFDRRALLRGAVAVAAASTFPLRRSYAGDAVGSTGEKVMLSDAAIADLQKSIKGTVILPSSADYDTARKVWNPAIDHHPALIAKCTSAEDIQAAVQFARAHNLLTAVRCGGHDYSGFGMAEGGLTIDLSPFGGVEVDTAKKIAWVSGGAKLGNLDRATVPQGLATTAGVVSHTGVGGLATGCGQGRLARKYGYTVDNIRGVEIITPDGRLLRANAKENPDLYWAVRGGGGNFGIVTKFELQLYDFDPTVTSFSYTFSLEKAKDMMNLYFELSAKVPHEMSLSGGLGTSEKGETTASISGTYLGPPEAAEKIVASISKLGEPIRKRFDGIDYVKLQSIADGTPLSKQAVHYRSGFFNHVDAKVSEVVVDYMTKSARPNSLVRFSQQGGAPNKVAPHATAFVQRDALHQCAFEVDWTDPKDAAACRKYADDSWAVIGPLSDGGFYINMAVDPSEADIRRTFRGNYDRLSKIKAKYDPTNFFHLNPNIKPHRA